MQLGITLYPYDRWPDIAAITAAVVRAEELGFGSVGLPEHLMLPTAPAASTPGRTNRTWYDNFVLATVLATSTTNIRLHLSALVIPYRHPLLAAKSLATLDVVSGGRVDVTAGVGWLGAEFASLGVALTDRGARTDDYLDAMRALWTMDEVSYAGSYVMIEGAHVEPKCVQRPHVPLLIGGSGSRARERVLRVGSGWAPMRGTPDELAPAVEGLREDAMVRGRDPAALRFFTRVDLLGGDTAIRGARAHADPDGAGSGAATADAAIGELLRYRRAGFAEMGVAFPWSDHREFVERLEWIAEHVAPGLPT